jgi:hypothetical protein
MQLMVSKNENVYFLLKFSIFQASKSYNRKMSYKLEYFLYQYSKEKIKDGNTLKSTSKRVILPEW